MYMCTNMCDTKSCPEQPPPPSRGTPILFRNLPPPLLIIDVDEYCHQTIRMSHFLHVEFNISLCLACATNW